MSDRVGRWNTCGVRPYPPPHRRSDSGN